MVIHVWTWKENIFHKVFGGEKLPPSWTDVDGGGVFGLHCSTQGPGQLSRVCLLLGPSSREQCNGELSCISEDPGT